MLIEKDRIIPELDKGEWFETIEELAYFFRLCMECHNHNSTPEDPCVGYDNIIDAIAKNWRLLDEKQMDICDRFGEQVAGWAGVDYAFCSQGRIADFRIMLMRIEKGATES